MTSKNLDRLRGHDERVMLRRETDKVQFHTCPKYDKHDLTHEQVIEIVDIAIKKMKDQGNIEFAEYIKEQSRDMIPKILIGFGTAILGLIFWLHDKGVFK